VKISPKYDREVRCVYVAVYCGNSNSGLVQKYRKRGREGGLANSTLSADYDDLSQTNPLLRKRFAPGSVA